MLSAKNLKKSFRSRPVVKGISLNVHSGETVGLLGPNGAGKTTSFHIIVGLIRADQGNIQIDDREITALPIDQRSCLGLAYLPQRTSIFRKLTVAENIMAILQTRTDISEDQAQQRLETLLHEFNIGHLRNNIGTTLSGGECRRVEIARSLTTDPLFLLLDEPFAGIDPISVDNIQKIIRRLNQQNIGILITDHNVRETLSICDRAYICNEGEIAAVGTPDEILQNEQVKKTYLGEEFNL